VLAALGIAATAIALLTCSALDVSLGLPTFLSGLVTTVVVLIAARSGPLPLIKDIAWAWCRWSPGFSCWSRRCGTPD